MKPTYEELEVLLAERDAEIDNLRKIQQQVLAAKDYYLKIFEDFPALIWRARLDKKCDYFNRTWLDFTGRTLEQEFGDGWAEMVHPEDLNFCFQTYVENFDQRKPFLMEYRMMNKYGEYRWIRDFGRPFYGLDDEFAGYIGSCYDVTDVKNNEKRLIETAEELQRTNATKDKLFSIIAHDLKSPMNTILVTTELMVYNAEKYSREDFVKHAARLMEASERSNRLLDDLLDWSLSQLGRLSIQADWFDIKELIDETFSALRDVASRKQVNLSCRQSEQCKFFSDKNLLKVVLRNIVANAIKYSKPDKEVTINYALSNGNMLIEIADSGIGMSEARQKTLFRTGAKESEEGTNHEKGTGLGLIVCKEFMDILGGTITVKSREGEGTTFSIRLPLMAK